MTHHKIASLLVAGGLVAGSVSLMTGCGDNSPPTGAGSAATTAGASPGYDAGSPPADSTSVDKPPAAGGQTVAAAASGQGPGPIAASVPAAIATPTAASAADTAASQTAQSASSPSPAASAASGSASAGPGALYKVVDGNKVDAETLKGFRTWRAAACDRCHGANQEGMVGPSLIASLKTLTKEQFATVVAEGRLAKGMPAFKTSSQVMENMDQLYAYLKGRSDGAITSAKVEAIE